MHITQYLFQDCRLRFLIAFLLLINPHHTYALVRLEPFNDTGKYTIIIKGEIAEVDEEDLKTAISTVHKNNYKLHLSMVQMDSPGGSKSAGIAIGRLIRKHKLNTFIAPESRCNSACVLAFIGGVQRYGFGKIGIHSTTYSDGAEIIEKFVPYVVDKDIETITNYVKEQRISPQLSSAILATPFWTLKFLSSAEKTSWSVNGTDRIEAEILVTRIAKERSMRRGDFATLAGKRYNECFNETQFFQQTAWDCMKNETNFDTWIIKFKKIMSGIFPSSWSDCNF